MSRLAPCPWCAAGEYDFRENKHWTGMRDRLLSVDLVHWCDPRGVLPRLTVTLTARTAAECAEAWNRRANIESVPTPGSDPVAAYQRLAELCTPPAEPAPEEEP